MTTDERLERLERATAALARGHSARYTMRPALEGQAGIAALRGIVAEDDERIDAEDDDREREKLQARLAELGSAG